MSADHFSLWLQNRHLFNDLTDDTIKEKQENIIDFFGGFRAMIDLCMAHQYNLDMMKHQKLFKLLNTLKDNQEATHVEKYTKLSLFEVHEVGISVIFKFLNLRDHISLQKTCMLATVIGRRRESFSDFLYYDDFEHLRPQHTMPYFIELLQSNEVDDWQKAADILENDWDRDESNKAITHSGIIPLLLELMDEKSQDFDFNNQFLTFMFCQLSDDNIGIYVKHGLLNSIKKCIPLFEISDSFDCIGRLLRYILDCNESYSIVLNRMDIFGVIMSIFFRFECADFPIVLNLIQRLLACPQFDYVKNENLLHELVNTTLFDCIKAYIERDEEEKEEEDEVWAAGVDIIETFVAVKKVYDFEFDIDNNEQMHLLLCLVQHIEADDLPEVVTILLWIEILLLVVPNIFDFIIAIMITDFDKRQVMAYYLQLIANSSRIYRSPESEECVAQLRNHLFRNVQKEDKKLIESYENQIQTAMIKYFDAGNRSLHCLDYVSELLNLSNVIHRGLSAFQSEHYYWAIKFKMVIATFLRKSKSFGYMMINKLTNSPVRTLKFLCGVIKKKKFMINAVMNNPCKIYKAIINASYAEQSTAYGIECILYLWKKVSYQFRPMLIKAGIVYLFRDFICRFYAFYDESMPCKVRKNFERELYGVLRTLDWIKYSKSYKTVCHKLTLDTSMKECVLKRTFLLKELRETITSSTIWQQTSS